MFCSKANAHSHSRRYDVGIALRSIEHRNERIVRGNTKHLYALYRGLEAFSRMFVCQPSSFQVIACVDRVTGQEP